MDKIILHDIVNKKISNFIKNPFHALLITGQTGVGKTYLASNLAASLLNLDIKKINGSANFLISVDEINTPGMERIKVIKDFLGYKTNYKGVINRIVLIDKADLLSIEASNSLLKLLEEPPQGSLIILLSKNKSNILNTIISRVQIIEIIKPPKEELINFFQTEMSDKNEVLHAYFVSNGLPGLMYDILNNNRQDLNLATDYARKFLTANNYQRIVLINQFSKDKQMTYYILKIIQQMSQLNLMQNKINDSWININKKIYEALDQINNNTQPRLVMLNLIVSMIV